MIYPGPKRTKKNPGDPGPEYTEIIEEPTESGSIFLFLIIIVIIGIL